MFAEVCIEYWETIAFLCPREIVCESENALHLRADSGSTFAELRVLDQKSGSTLFEIAARIVFSLDIDVIAFAASGSVTQHFQLCYIVRCFFVLLQKIQNDMLSPGFFSESFCRQADPLTLLFCENKKEKEKYKR